MAPAAHPALSCPAKAGHPVSEIGKNALQPRLLDRPAKPDDDIYLLHATRARYACSPNFSAAVQVRQLSCGIWMWVEPRNANASLTALEKHGTPPTFGLSPTPLGPIGWRGR